MDTNMCHEHEHVFLQYDNAHGNVTMNMRKYEYVAKSTPQLLAMGTSQASGSRSRDKAKAGGSG